MTGDPKLVLIDTTCRVSNPLGARKLETPANLRILHVAASQSQDGKRGGIPKSLKKERAKSSAGEGSRLRPKEESASGGSAGAVAGGIATKAGIGRLRSFATILRTYETSHAHVSQEARANRERVNAPQ